MYYILETQVCVRVLLRKQKEKGRERNWRLGSANIGFKSWWRPSNLDGRLHIAHARNFIVFVISFCFFDISEGVLR